MMILHSVALQRTLARGIFRELASLLCENWPGAITSSFRENVSIVHNAALPLVIEARTHARITPKAGLYCMVVSLTCLLLSFRIAESPPTLRENVTAMIQSASGRKAYHLPVISLPVERIRQILGRAS